MVIWTFKLLLVDKNWILALFYFSGYDTWHDASQKGRSVGGIVATINPLLSRYVSLYFITYEFVTRLHSYKQKLIMIFFAFFLGELHHFPHEQRRMHWQNSNLCSKSSKRVSFISYNFLFPAIQSFYWRRLVPSSVHKTKIEFILV